MPFLCISTCFPSSTYHGRLDGNEPEWPPSPLRLFQSLVAAATSGGGCPLPDDAAAVLRWLERRLPPLIVAPTVVRGTGYRLSVPNNAMDIVARAWCRGTASDKGDANPATHRAMKTVRPIYVDEHSPLCFLWRIDGDTPPEARQLISLARRIVALGWGIDLVIADGAIVDDDHASALEGVRWAPIRSDSARGLRVPVAGTLDDVLNRHRRFLSRLQSDTFDAPPPLREYAVVSYQPASVRRAPSRAVFSLLNPNGDGFRSFDAADRALTVAGMTRHAARAAADRSRWPVDRINTVVLGHSERRGDAHAPVESRRFAYVPLPSIEPRGTGEVVGGIRRVMVTMLGGESEGEVAWAGRALVGQPLISARDAGQVALLGRVAGGDSVTKRYVDASSTWTSVTPVVLPGYDDPSHCRRRLRHVVDANQQRDLLARLDARTERLIRKAIVQAGFPTELAEHARIEWCRNGFLAGTQPADCYGVPDHLKRFTRLHVRITWCDRLGRPVEVRGPCVLGGGRFYGLGLLAA